MGLFADLNDPKMRDLVNTMVQAKQRIAEQVEPIEPSVAEATGYESFEDQTERELLLDCGD